MDLKQFIKKIKGFYELKKSEQVVYFAYYLSEIKDDGTFFQKDIRSCFDELDLDLTLNLSIFFTNNSTGKDKLFINKKKKGYSLEIRTKKRIEQEVSIEKVDIDTSDKILQYNFQDTFYGNLLNEINKTYYHGCYTASFILIRKLFENLLIDILRNNFKNEKSLYLSEHNKKKYNDFSVLLHNLSLKRSEFNFTTTEIDSITDSLKPYRIEANAKTHSIVEFGKKEDIEKYNVQDTFNLLERLWNN